MTITEELELFFGEDKPEIKKEKKKIERVPAGSPYWVMILNPENENEIIPRKRIEQGFEELERMVKGKPTLISKNSIDETYATYRNYFYLEQDCIEHIKQLKENAKRKSDKPVRRTNKSAKSKDVKSD